MTPDPPDAIRELLDRIRNFLHNHEAIRDGVGVVGRALAAFAEWSAPAVPDVPAQTPADVPAEPTVTEPPTAVSPPVPVEPVSPPAASPLPATLSPPVPVAALPVLTFKPLSQSPEPAHGGEIEPLPPQMIAARCRLKAEAARFIAHRSSTERMLDTAGVHADLTRRANDLGDCFLWMLDSRGSCERPDSWIDLAEAFEAAADTA